MITFYLLGADELQMKKSLRTEFLKENGISFSAV